MKPQQLARLLDISPVTLRHWCANELGEFLSPSARGVKGAKRSFGDQDARIIAWVANMKTQNSPLGDIVATLRAAQADSWRKLPPLPAGIANDEPIAVIPREAAEERLIAIQERYEMQLQATIKERDELQSRLNDVRTQMGEIKTENIDLRQQLKAVTEQVLDLNRRLTSLLEKEQRRRK